jgi:hypothetical protein
MPDLTFERRGPRACAIAGPADFPLGHELALSAVRRCDRQMRVGASSIASPPSSERAPCAGTHWRKDGVSRGARRMQDQTTQGEAHGQDEAQAR